MRFVILIQRETPEGPAIGWDSGRREMVADIADAKVYEFAAEIGARVAALVTDRTIVEVQVERRG